MEKVVLLQLTYKDHELNCTFTRNEIHTSLISANYSVEEKKLLSDKYLSLIKFDFKEYPILTRTV